MGWKRELLLTKIGKALGGTDWERVRSEVGLGYINIEVPIRCAEADVKNAVGCISPYLQWEVKLKIKNWENVDK